MDEGLRSPDGRLAGHGHHAHNHNGFDVTQTNHHQLPGLGGTRDGDFSLAITEHLAAGLQSQRPTFSITPDVK